MSGSQLIFQPHASSPHYYLQSIGVEPAAQGRGLSSALIKPFIRQADTRGMGVYTETVTPSNVTLYEHVGIKCVEEVLIGKTGLHVWGFYRSEPGK